MGEEEGSSKKKKQSKNKSKSKTKDASANPSSEGSSKKKKSKKKDDDEYVEDEVPPPYEEEEVEVPSTIAQPISSTTQLDSKTVEMLSQLDSFYVQQRIRWIEAVTQGCWEQPNIYDVFDKNTNKRLFIIKEESEIWSRCCCSPEHSVFLKFYHDENAPETQPGQKTDWSYEPSEPPFMTMEREGCDCCCGECPKPCLCCFACTEGCSEHATLHAGDLSGDPGSMKGNREKTKLLGESVQPIGGGGFKPVMQLMDRGSGTSSDNAEMFAATRGPCFFGGCSELCCDTKFGITVAQPGMNVKQIHKLPFGDFASIDKKKPKNLSQAAREFFTDSDIYEVDFHSKAITPQQKANVLATMVHLDYMFFERDNDMCYYDGDGRHIVFCNCFIYGCVCPCQIVLNNNSGGGN